MTPRGTGSVHMIVRLEVAGIVAMVVRGRGLRIVSVLMSALIRTVAVLMGMLVRVGVAVFVGVHDITVPVFVRMGVRVGVGVLVGVRVVVLTMHRGPP